jgi:regulator of protease activity HflC (stomatin/prohibitin superfamily)
MDMATVTRYPFARHLRTAPTAYVVHVRRGKVRHGGPGLAFWYRPLSAVLSEVPVDDRELPLVVRARTVDLQDVAVQATVSYRFADPRRAVQRVDFGIDPVTGEWTGSPLEAVGGLLTELAASHVLTAAAGLSLQAAVSTGAVGIRDAMAAGLRADERLTGMGIAVLDARVGAVRSDADLERFLQAPTREQAQAEADRASFERRALAVERERAIAENELRNRIELATREEALVTQEGVNARRRAEEAAAAALVEADATAARQGVLAAAEANGIRVVGEANAAAEAAKLAAYRGVEPPVLAALAARELAAHLPRINNLTLTPDLVTGALAGVLGPRP